MHSTGFLGNIEKIFFYDKTRECIQDTSITGIELPRKCVRFVNIVGSEGWATSVF